MKFGSVIGGRSVDIKRMTFRQGHLLSSAQGGLKEDASALCARLKSAGGSFASVTQ